MKFIKEVKNYLHFLKIEKRVKQKKVYFYSESKNYRNYLLEIIKGASEKGNIKVIYFTSDHDDKLNIKNVDEFVIGKGIVRLVFFTFLKCDLMIMTLTDLNNFEIKKSKNCKKYLYVFHSLMSVFKGYNKKAYQHYDIIFANGEYQVKELKRMEELYNFNKKEIFNIGYTYIESLTKIINKNISDGSILFAPSWIKQKNDLLEIYGEKIISKFLEMNKVILRPHPQSLIKSKKELKKICETFQSNRNFFYNNSIGKVDTLDKSSLLVTDNGGMAMEYYILYNRPIISIQYLEKIHNEQYKELGFETLEDKFKKEFTKVIKIEEIDNIKSISENYLKNFIFDKKKLDKFFDENGVIFNGASKQASLKLSEIINLKN